MEESQVPPQVSVLIVSHNCAPALRRCLAALEQSGEREKFEVLVIDNASRDESPQLDTEFPSATFLRLPRHFGLVKALNIGMRTAKGEFFFFLAPEAEVMADTLPALAARLAAAPEAVAVCPLAVTPEGQPQPRLFQLPAADAVASLAWRGAWVESARDLEGECVPVAFPSLAPLLVRSYFLKGLRYIDERYGETWADAEIAFQIRRAGKKILLCPGVRVVSHPAEAAPADSSVRALFSADWALGAATFAGKHYGFVTGLKVRVLAILHALVQAIWSVLRFSDAGYYFSRLNFLVSGQKLDGTQRVL